MGLRLDSLKGWLRALVGDGEVFKRNGTAIVGVEPSTLTTRQTVTFALPNVAAGDNATVASATPVQLYACGVSALDTCGYVAPRAGSLTALSAHFSGNAAGSSLIVSVHKNGTLLHASAIATIASGEAKGRATFTAGTYTFDAGDVLDVRVRTGSGWSATTRDIAAYVEIAD
jgi:hypothetical protein